MNKQLIECVPNISEGRDIDKINTIAKEITRDPDYKRIPLDTKEDIDWFVTQSFLYWDGKSSKKEFIDIGLKRFPGYRDSFEYLAKRLKK